MLSKFEVVQQMMNGLQYREYFTAQIHNQMAIILAAVEHVLSLEDGANRYLKETTALIQAYALCKTTPEARNITEEVAFFQAVRARIIKLLGISGPKGGSVVDVSTIMKQMVDRAFESTGVVDILK